MIHREAHDCPCRPQFRDQLGGGRVIVHRTQDETDGRRSVTNRAPDRYCPLCGGWHFVGYRH